MCERGRLFFQGVSCTFYCFGWFTQSKDLVNFVLKKKKKEEKRAVHKTPVSANLFFRLSFSHSAVSLAIPSGLLCFHGNPGIKASYVSVCTRADK